MEGIIRISSRLIGFHEGHNIRTYPIWQVENVHLSPGGGVVEVYLQHLKQPLVIIWPDFFECQAAS
ncbi:hypothetical protein [Cecembia rubra]|uniref:hypothetical protein n=1 Tax=Cecembia rubra TaxID=1485585 RepID=UPI000D0DA719|nr:hypothetical protein [Cecembia rubra]